MGTEPSGRSVEDRGTDPAGALVLPVVDLLQRLEHVLVAALGVLEDLLLRGRVVHALEGLLDVEGAYHGPGLPPSTAGDARIPSGSARRDDRRAAGRPRPAQGRRRPRPGRRHAGGGRRGHRAAAERRGPGRPTAGPGGPDPPGPARAGAAERAVRC